MVGNPNVSENAPAEPPSPRPSNIMAKAMESIYLDHNATTLLGPRWSRRCFAAEEGFKPESRIALGNGHTVASAGNKLPTFCAHDWTSARCSVDQWHRGQ